MIRKLVALCVVALCLVESASFLQLSTAYSSEPSLKEKAVSYIQAVLPINFTQYTVTYEGEEVLPRLSTDYWRGVNVHYHLNSSGSDLKVRLDFENGALYDCEVTPLRGSIASDRDYLDVTEVARTVLERHQAYTGIDSSTPIQLLSLLNGSQTSAALDNYTLNLVEWSLPVGCTFFRSFKWVFTLTGCEVMRLTMKFENGVFSYISDMRTMYTASNAEVKVTREEAVNIATSHLQTYGYNVTPFSASANLWYSAAKTNGTLLYPLCDVIFDGERTSGASYSVTILADTGEVLRSYRDSTTLKTQDPNTLPAPEATPEPPSIGEYLPIVIVAVTLLSAVAIAAVVLAAKRRKPSSNLTNASFH
jgi:hypothetical protein